MKGGLVGEGLHVVHDAILPSISKDGNDLSLHFAIPQKLHVSLIPDNSESIHHHPCVTIQNMDNYYLLADRVVRVALVNSWDTPTTRIILKRKIRI